MKSPIRLERRLEQPKWLNWAIPVFSLVAALILGAVVLFATGKNPWDVYHRIFERGFAGTLLALGHWDNIPDLPAVHKAQLLLARRTCQSCWERLIRDGIPID